MAVDLARWQFGVTTVYHFLFVPLTIGLGFLIAILESIYVAKNDEKYKKMAQFWMKFFLINLAIAVVTGIFQEFQFGMNWSTYSRFVGDVFGPSLAVEGLAAFFLESTFLGVWLFGWERLPKKVHLASIWLVSLGSTLSAFWILTANAFMQEPMGYAIHDGRAEMTSFGAILTNPQLWVEFPHVFFGAIATGSFFMVGISAWYLLRKRSIDLFQPSFRIATVFALISSILTAVVGHEQAQHEVVAQPMKMAAAEALWNTSPLHAPETLIAGIDVAGHHNTFAIKIPYLLSILCVQSTVRSRARYQSITTAICSKIRSRKLHSERRYFVLDISHHGWCRLINGSFKLDRPCAFPTRPRIEAQLVSQIDADSYRVTLHREYSRLDFY